MGPLNEVKEPHLYAAIRALFGQPIANTRILTLTAVGINLCGLSGTAGNEPSGDNTKGKCNKSLAEIGKILDKRGRLREKRDRERISGKELVNWSPSKYLDRLSSCDSVVWATLFWDSYHFLLSCLAQILFSLPSPSLSVSL